MGRAISVCTHPGCLKDATTAGRCPAHQRRPWGNRSPSSVTLNGTGKNAHRRARRVAARRARGRCERCGRRSDDLQLHHPDPISEGGAIVQDDAQLLCLTCHRSEHHG